MRFRWFVLGIIVTIVALFGGAYLYLTSSAVSMATSAPPLPFEETVAQLALRASYGNTASLINPLPLNDDNMAAGAHVFRQHCGACHGLPGKPSTALSKAMFPHPPQLLEKDGMVTDDPEGIIYWTVTNGIRLSGMPAFESALSPTERWQVTMLVSHADKISPAAQSALNK